MVDRKGISEYISAMFLILIVVAVSAIISTWGYEFFKKQSETVENQTSQRLICKYGSFYIERAIFNCSNDCSAGVNHFINITVRNTGQIKLTFDRIYVENTNYSIFEFSMNRTELSTGEIDNFVGISNESCTAINNSISKIRLVSINCPDVYDTFDGNVEYVSC